MCTLTFIPKPNNGFILTSSRDEAPGRETVPPEFYILKNIKLLFPKDKLAGGSWIGASSKKRVICLLNGGFTAHEREEKYRMSRGIIVTDLLTSENITEAIKNYDFNEIEPFTIILIDFEAEVNLYELVWDGSESHFSEKPLAPQIWSSSLLYTEEVKQKREQWFSSFLMENLKPSEEILLDFHKTAGEGNPQTDIVMDRGFVATKSITQISKFHSNSKILMRYEDLGTKEIINKTFEF